MKIKTKNDVPYWEEFYKTYRNTESKFAKFCLPYLVGETVDLGCGQGRDLMYFLNNGITATGVDSAFGNDHILKMDVVEYMERYLSPDFVYTRFFWHSINNETRHAILDWTSRYLFIEARTTVNATEFHTYEDHYRNFVDVDELQEDLEAYSFGIIHLKTGYGMSPYKNEDPHLVRVIACRQ